MRKLENAKRPARDKLILAGIRIIEKSGIQGFSLRKAAEECGMSCAAPYKHFKNKDDLITCILQYINDQWALRQDRIIAAYPKDVRRQLIEIILEYIRFLVENPHFRSIIMIKDINMSAAQNEMKSQISEKSQELIRVFCHDSGISEELKQIETYVLRSLIYGAALMFDNGEITYNEENFHKIAYAIRREFDLYANGQPLE